MLPGFLCRSLAIARTRGDKGVPNPVKDRLVKARTIITDRELDLRVLPARFHINARGRKIERVLKQVTKAIGNRGITPEHGPWRLPLGIRGCCINFNDAIKTLFGAQYGLERRLPIALQFVTFGSDQRALLKRASTLP